MMEGGPEERASLLHARHSVSGRSGDGLDMDGSEMRPRMRRLSSTSGAVNRWQQSAGRVIQAARAVHAIDEAIERHEPGAAPGIDPRRNKYQHLAAKWCLPVTVTVCDYDSKEASIYPGMASAEDLSSFLTSTPRPRGSSRVRWIHVDGLNWEVIQLLALTYDLHPLALEDTVHVPQRIKSDFYDSCLYVSLIYLYLADGSADAAAAAAAAAAEAQYHTTHTAGPHAAGASPPTPSATPNASRRLPRTISSVRRAEAIDAAAALAGAAADLERNAAAAKGGGIFGGGGGSSSGGSGRRPRASIPGPAHYPLPLHRGSVHVSSATGMQAVGDGGGGGATAAGNGRVSGLGPGSGSSGSFSAPGAPGTASPGNVRSTFIAASGGGGSGGGGGGRHIHVSAQQVSLFLLRGEHHNTLVTVFQSDGSAVTQPILTQLREPRTLVREAEDASFLANLVIDTLVDHIFPVVGAYTEQLQQYEADVMGGHLPSAASTRELHAMQRDLRRIDRTIAPLQGVVANMIARDAAAGDAAYSRRTAEPSADGGPPPPSPSAGGGAGAGTSALLAPPTPFLSRLTRTYIGDVKDHVSTICEDLMSLSAECGDLIGLIFNLTTHQQSQSTQTLAVVSTIFLPITFLAGVYGMNFDILPELHWDYGYLYFWIASTTIVVVFMGVMLRAGLWSA